MKWSLRIATTAGTEVRIHASFLLLLHPVGECRPIVDLADALRDSPPAGEPVPEVRIAWLDALADDRERWEAARDAARLRARGPSSPRG